MLKHRRLESLIQVKRAQVFALINIPRHLFNQATAEAAKRKNTQLQ
jgi:hypothetical protein